jgi:hypothetical protein
MTTDSGVGKIVARIDDGRVTLLDDGQLVGLDTLSRHQVDEGEHHVVVILVQNISIYWVLLLSIIE